jgi:essential nuclear protein 1
MKPPQARVFLQGVVLDAVREDIRVNGKLNVHYYETLKRSLYNPAAFFKGIVFPLLDVSLFDRQCVRRADRTRTRSDRMHAQRSCDNRFRPRKSQSPARALRSRHHPPREHGLLGYAPPHARNVVELQTNVLTFDVPGPNSLFIRVLVDKKYALPYKVVDALVFHFIRLSNTYKAKKGESEKLPVLWHQSLLVFAQRYVLISRGADWIISPISPLNSRAHSNHQRAPRVILSLYSS